MFSQEKIIPTEFRVFFIQQELSKNFMVAQDSRKYENRSINTSSNGQRDIFRTF